jgi:ubiquitin-like protein Pup
MELRTTTRSRRAEEDGLLGVVTAADSTQRKAPKKGGGEGEEADAAGSQKLAKRGKELKEEMDALVDEIDEVLEENAEEFVKNYVQRGGE